MGVRKEDLKMQDDEITFDDMLHNAYFRYLVMIVGLALFLSML
jgi:hypothetical protein